jgi:hypothetical protein
MDYGVRVRGLMNAFRRRMPWLVPCFLIFAYTAPLVQFQLPNYESVLGEEYPQQSISRTSRMTGVGGREQGGRPENVPASAQLETGRALERCVVVKQTYGP